MRPSLTLAPRIPQRAKQHHANSYLTRKHMLMAHTSTRVAYWPAVQCSLLSLLERNGQPKRNLCSCWRHEGAEVALDQMKRAMLKFRDNVDELILGDELQFCSCQLPQASSISSRHRTFQHPGSKVAASKQAAQPRQVRRAKKYTLFTSYIFQN